MCFHSKQSKDVQKAEKRFKAKVKKPDFFHPSEYYNGFTFPQTPIITSEEPKIIQHFNWGLIPHWAKDESIRQYTLNAKIESLEEKPSFREITHQRCLILSDGFFEWQWQDSKGKNKQKYLISLPSEELFAYGGLWSQWENQNSGEIINSYSIITTEANKLMSEIHNSKKRMPLVLTPDNEEQWLQQKDISTFIHPQVDLKAIPLDPLPSLF